MPEPVMIEWDVNKLKRLIKAHKEALEKVGRDGSFIFDDNEFVVAYAGYLIEYLKSKFGMEA